MVGAETSSPSESRLAGACQDLRGVSFQRGSFPRGLAAFHKRTIMVKSRTSLVATDNGGDLVETAFL